MLDEDAGQRQTDGGADAEGGAHRGDRSPDAFAGQFVAQDADADGNHRGAHTLEGASCDEGGETVTQGAEKRSGDDEPERDEHDAPLADHVGQAREDRRCHGSCEQRCGDEPGRVLRARVEQRRPLRDERYDERLLERHDRAGHTQHGDDETLAGGSRRCGVAGGHRAPHRWCRIDKQYKRVGSPCHLGGTERGSAHARTGRRRHERSR